MGVENDTILIDIIPKRFVQSITSANYGGCIIYESSKAFVELSGIASGRVFIRKSGGKL